MRHRWFAPGLLALLSCLKRLESGYLNPHLACGFYFALISVLGKEHMIRLFVS
jgi:hypothetical protein